MTPASGKIDFLWGAREKTGVRPVSTWSVGGIQARKHCAHLQLRGASGQSKGGPEPLTEITSFSLCLTFGGNRCRN